MDNLSERSADDPSRNVTPWGCLRCSGHGLYNNAWTPTTGRSRGNFFWRPIFMGRWLGEILSALLGQTPLPQIHLHLH